MKTLAKTLGIEPQEPPEASKSQIERRVEDMAPGADLDELAVRRGQEDLEVVIAEGVAAIRETFSGAADLDPKTQNRAREVGAQLIKSTVDAIKQKQDAAMKNIDRRARVKSSASGDTVGVVTDRESILRLIASRPDFALAIDVAASPTDNKYEDGKEKNKNNG